MSYGQIKMKTRTLSRVQKKIKASTFEALQKKVRVGVITSNLHQITDVKFDVMFNDVQIGNK